MSGKGEAVDVKKETDELYEKTKIMASDFHGADKKKIWAGYHNEKEIIKQREINEQTKKYGERFFVDLEFDEDATGWQWVLSSKPEHCDLCKANAGTYPLGQGPKYPAHDGCTCGLRPSYK